jgi:hypothetical protein
MSLNTLYLLNVSLTIRLNNATKALAKKVFVDQKPFLYLVSSAAPRRTAYSKVGSLLAAHLRTGAVPCTLGRLPDSNPGLQIYRLVLLPMSHHYAKKVHKCQILNYTMFAFLCTKMPQLHNKTMIIT